MKSRPERNPYEPGRGVSLPRLYITRFTTCFWLAAGFQIDSGGFTIELALFHRGLFITWR